MARPLRWALAILFLLTASEAWAQKYQVAFKSDPAGASVYVDDTESEPLGITPFTARLAAGEYTIIVELDGHEPSVEALTVRRRRRQTLSVSLTKLPTGYLILSPAEEGEDFSDSTILVDGQERKVEAGEKIEIPAGPHQVEVVRKGFETYEAWIEVSEGGTNSVSVNFVAKGEGGEGDEGFGDGKKTRKKKPTPTDLSGEERFHLAAGIEAGGRVLRYPKDTTTMIREEYTLLVASRLRINADAYPLATRYKYLGGLGIGASAGLLLFPRSSKTDTGGEQVSHNWYDLTVDLRYRLKLGEQFWAGVSLGYAIETFSFSSSEILIDTLSPSSYKQIEFSLLGGVTMDKLQIYGGLTIPRVSSAGQFADERFEAPAITAVGMTAGAFRRVTPTIDLVIGLTYNYYALKFGAPKAPQFDAVSATDQYFGAMIGLGYRR